MNHYAVRKRECDGRYDFTCQNNGAVWPVGYCCHFIDLTEEEQQKYCLSDERLEIFRSHANKHHSSGHATPEEAAECYRQFMLDQNLWINLRSEELLRCLVCQTLTHSRVRIGSIDYWPMCETHNNRAEVEQLYPVTLQYHSSY
jgi:hypothetical protein